MTGVQTCALPIYKEKQVTHPFLSSVKFGFLGVTPLRQTLHWANAPTERRAMHKRLNIIMVLDDKEVELFQLNKENNSAWRKRRNMRWIVLVLCKSAGFQKPIWLKCFKVAMTLSNTTFVPRFQNAREYELFQQLQKLLWKPSKLSSDIIK